MHAFLQNLSSALQNGPVVLVTVIAAQGSTPRLAGARMAVNSSGIVAGTIGGGITESRVLELARQTLGDAQPRKLEADLRGRPGEIRDGICGGTMTLWLTRLTRENAGAEVTEALAALATGRAVTFSTAFANDRPLSLDPSPDRFTETLEPDPHLLIVGAGHIGRCLAALAAGLHFRLTVQDERDDWRDPATFPASCELTASLSGAATRLAAWEGRRFAALVTRGFPQDLEALGTLSRQPGLTYVGLLGSRKRIQTVLAAHKASGAPDFPAGVLHAPVGVEIGAETPEEIAVSIAAEMIRVLRNGLRP
jgi:xanthine dehydrogenase accessory factor